MTPDRDDDARRQLAEAQEPDIREVIRQAIVEYVAAEQAKEQAELQSYIANSSHASAIEREDAAKELAAARDQIARLDGQAEAAIRGWESVAAQLAAALAREAALVAIIADNQHHIAAADLSVQAVREQVAAWTEYSEGLRGALERVQALLKASGWRADCDHKRRSCEEIGCNGQFFRAAEGVAEQALAAPSLETAERRREREVRDAAVELALEIAGTPWQYDDDRIDYVEIQIAKSDILRIRSLCAQRAPGPGSEGR